VTVRAYEASPAGDEARPALILIHESVGSHAAY
jgi:dienelactone hydrolase